MFMPSLSFQQVNYSKFMPPKVHALYFARARLFAHLDSARNRRFTLLQAPQGYGKSSLLSDWFHSARAENNKQQLLWFRVDELDRDSRCFWGNLIEHMESCWPGLKQAIIEQIELLEQTSPFQMILAVANYIIKNTDKNLYYTLVFDDFESFKLSDSEGQFFLFAGMLPTNINIVIASKELLNIKPIEQDAYGTYALLGVSELKIRRDEIKAFLELDYQIDISDSDIEVLYLKTEGWPLSLYQVRNQLEDGVGIDAVVEELSGPHHHLGDAVFRKTIQDLPQKVMMFLLETSFLECFSASLCNYVFDNNEALAIIEHLERSGIFILAVDLDHEWYRYHCLFAEWLRSQALSLHRDQIRVLNHKAANWYRANDKSLLSAKHTVAASEGWFIVGLTKCVYTRSVLKDSDFFSWLFNLSEPSLQRQPFFCLSAAWAFAFSGRPNDARQWLAQAFELVEQGRSCTKGVLLEGAFKGEEPHFDRELFGRTKTTDCVIRAKCFTLEGDARKGVELSHALLVEREPFIDDRLKMVLYQNLGEAYELIGNLDNAAKYYQKTMTIAQVNRYDFLVGFSRYQLIRLIYLQGKLEEAEKLCRVAIVECPQDFSVYGALYSVLGLIEIMQNNTEKLEVLLKRAFGRVSPDRNIDIYLDVSIARCKYLMMCGDYSEALLQIAVARKAILENDDIPPRGVAPLVYAQQARLFVKLKDYDSALETLQEYHALGFPPTEESTLLYGIIHALVAIERHQATDDTILDLQRLAREAGKGKYVLYQIEIYLLITRHYYAAENQGEATKYLKKGLDLAKSDNIIQLFLDEGEVIRLLLVEQIGSRKLSYDSDRFARKMMSAFDNMALEAKRKQRGARWTHEPAEGEGVPFVDHWGLTNREGEVLQLLMRGMNRKEIAAALCTSQNTAKTHISHIYEKMDVHSISELLRRMMEHEEL